MSFLDTFGAVFIGTFLAQISLWLIERYNVKNHFNKTLDRFQIGKRNTELIQMGKAMLDIEKASNGSYVVTWYKSVPNALQKLGGTKAEKEQLAFSTSREIVEWIDKNI